MSTPIPSLQCEANIIPASFFIKEQAIKTYYKLKTKGENHPVYKYILNEEIRPKKDWSIHTRKPFTQKIKEILTLWNLEENTLPNLEKIISPKIPPWEPLESSIYLDLIIPLTKAASRKELKDESLRTIDLRFSEHIKIYTDGSKLYESPTQEPSTSAAFYSKPLPEPNEKEEIKGHWHMHKEISIVGAELSAIHKAAANISIDTRNFPVPKPVVILTDSKVSLQLMLQRKPKAYAFSVTSIHENIINLRQIGWDISFQWIPSHCDIQGNEIADQTATLAHVVDVIDNYPIEMEELLAKLKKQSLI